MYVRQPHPQSSLLEKMPAEESAHYLIHLVREARLVLKLVRNMLKLVEIKIYLRPYLLLDKDRKGLAPRHHSSSAPAAVLDAVAAVSVLEIARRCHFRSWSNMLKHYF